MNEETDAQAAASWQALRPEVQAYAQRMEQRLRAHDADRGRAGWKGDTTWDLFNHLAEEVRELEEALWEWDDDKQTAPPLLAARIADEAADIGNMAMMVADVSGAWAPMS